MMERSAYLIPDLDPIPHDGAVWISYPMMEWSGFLMLSSCMNAWYKIKW